MTRTQVLQEIRRMRFEEAYGGWQSRRLTQEEAARLLGGGVSARSGAAWTATRTRDTTGWWTSAWARSRRGAPRSTRCCACTKCSRWKRSRLSPGSRPTTPGTSTLQSANTCVERPPSGTARCRRSPRPNLGTWGYGLALIFLEGGRCRTAPESRAFPDVRSRLETIKPPRRLATTGERLDRTRWTGPTCPASRLQIGCNELSIRRS